MENTHNLIIPRTNLIGVGALKDLPTELLSNKLSKALIVTDKNMVTLGYVNMVETILKSLFITYDVFDGILHPNPTVGFVESGLSYFDKGINLLKRDYGFIISIGGSTNHDCAKGIAIVATNGGSIIDYEGYKKLTKAPLPLIAINTTAGGASELTSFAVITDEKRKLKMTIGDPRMAPVVSVNEPMFMSTMPKEITASSGIDVLCQSIETYVSTEVCPISDALALKSIKTVLEYLRRAYENGNDLEAREKMMFANVCSGMAFNNGGLGLVHAISHQIGGHYNTVHGVSNAILLPYVIEYNSTDVPEERLIDIAEAMGKTARTKSKALKKIIEAIQKLSNDVEIPSTLKSIGAQKRDFENIAQNSLKDICYTTNPKQAAIPDVLNILTKAY